MTPKGFASAVLRGLATWVLLTVLLPRVYYPLITQWGQKSDEPLALVFMVGVLVSSVVWAGVWLGAPRLAGALLPRDITSTGGGDARLWQSLIHLFLGGLMLFMVVAGAPTWLFGNAFYFGGVNPQLLPVYLVLGILLVFDGRVLLGAMRRLRRRPRGRG